MDFDLNVKEKTTKLLKGTIRGYFFMTLDLTNVS